MTGIYKIIKEANFSLNLQELPYRDNISISFQLHTECPQLVSKSQRVSFYAHSIFKPSAKLV